MKPHSLKILGKFTPSRCSNTSITIVGHDNGDGDGPHWGSIDVAVGGQGDGSSSIQLVLHTLEDLKYIADTFNEAYHKAQDLKKQKYNNG